MQSILPGPNNFCMPVETDRNLLLTLEICAMVPQSYRGGDGTV